jgi:catechol 2,3-dioxygenase-like lactoylglutathione lyase family enzyme
MAKILQIQHVTVVVDDLEEACVFYEKELGLEPLPVFDLDFPAQFFKINEQQQLHVTEWQDKPSFRGHLCFQVDDFNSIFYRMKELQVIDTSPWGNVRRLPDGAMQMFVRDPSNNLIEISCPEGPAIDGAIFDDELVDAGTSLFKSGREDARGKRGDGATLYHGKSDES